MARGKAADVLVPGDHGSTYGGNPFACAAVCKTFEMIESRDIIKHVNEVSAYLEEKLDGLVSKYEFTKERRGLGLMQGIEVNVATGDIINGALEEGLILFSAGANVVRFLPPLVIENEHVDEMTEKLEKVLDRFA